MGSLKMESGSSFNTKGPFSILPPAFRPKLRMVSAGSGIEAASNAAATIHSLLGEGISSLLVQHISSGAPDCRLSAVSTSVWSATNQVH
jgi:hypothetical protein